MKRWTLWNAILAAFAVCVVVLAVKADQAELKKDMMASMYGVGTCKAIVTPAREDCTPTTCPESGYITQKNYGVEQCTDVTQDNGWRQCTAVGTRKECETWIYETSECTEVIHHNIETGTDYELTDYGPCP